MDRYFPGSGWLRLRRETLAELQRYKAATALPGWDDVVTDLLTRARAGARRRRQGIGAALAAGGLVLATVSGAALLHRDSSPDQAVTHRPPTPPPGPARADECDRRSA